MIITKTYNIDIPNSFTLHPNDEYVLDLSTISNFYEEKVVLISGVVKIFVNSIFPLSNLSIYSRSGNYDTFISNGFPSFDSSGNYYYVFDVSDFLFKNKYLSESLVIKCSAFLTSGSVVVQSSSTNQSHFSIESNSLDTHSNLESVVSDTVGEYASFEFNHLSQELIYRISLFQNILSFDVNLVYSSLIANSSLGFPIGWKLSLLDYLIVGSDYLIYVDKDNKEHRFKQIRGKRNFYYSIDGTGLLIEKKSTYYKLFSEVSSLYKKFDLTSGRITYSKGEGNRYISYNYVSNDEIQITDYKGNCIKIEFNNEIDILLNNTLYYSLGTNNNNQLSILYYKNKSDTFSYLDGVLYTASMRDNHALTINRANYKIYSLVKSYGTNQNDYYHFEYRVLKTTISNRHNIKSILEYNKDLKLLSTKQDNYNNVNQLFCRSIDGFDYDIELLSDNVRKISIYGANHITSFEIGSEETNQSYTVYHTVESGDDFSLQANEKYFLYAVLNKNSNFNFTNNKKAWIELYGLVNGYELICTLEFEPDVQSQTILLPFSPSFSTNNVMVWMKATGIIEEGGVTISDIAILKPNGTINSYYVNTNNSSSPEIDEIHWDKCENITNLNFEEATRDFVNDIKGNHYYWSDGFRSMNYILHFANSNLINANGNNISLAKKTIVKQYKSNDQLIDVYTFEYLKYENNKFYYITVKCNNNETFKSTKEYDTNLLLLKETNSDGDFTEYEYDNNNNLITKISGNTNSNEIFKVCISYDSLNRLISESSLISNNVATKSNSYYGSLEVLSKKTDPLSNEEEYFYSDLFEYESKISNGDSEINKNFDNESSFTLSNDSVFLMNKCPNGELGKYQIKTSSNSYSYLKRFYYSLNPIGDIYYKYENSSVINKQYIHDRFDRCIEVNKKDGSNFSPIANYFYFKQKPENLLTIETIDSLSACNNDKLYKIIDTVNSLRILFDYEKGNLSLYEVKTTTNSDNIYSIGYTYDDLGRLSTRSLFFNNEQLTQQFSYPSSFTNDPSSITYVVGGLSIHTYSITKDSLNRISTIQYYYSAIFGQKNAFTYYSKDVTSGGETTHLASRLVKRVDYYTRKYTIVGLIPQISEVNDESDYIGYDDNGNITSITKGTEAQNDPDSGVSYSYNSNKRIIGEINNQLGFSYTYQYDNNGNITSIIKLDLSTNQTETKTFTYNSYYKDKLESINNNVISYSNTNNPFLPTSYNGITFSWNDDSSLSSITKNGQTISFDYGHNGARIRKTIVFNNTSIVHDYVLENSTILAEKISASNSNDEKYIKYLYGVNGVYGFLYNGTAYFYRKNILGDVIAIYNISGALQARYVYDAWGNHVVYNSSGVALTYPNNSDHIGIINPFRYRSYYYDAETDLYYCLTRYYNPEWSRWISPDDADYLDPSRIDGINLYAYCLNNPIMYHDSNGNMAEWLLFIIIGSAIGFGSTFVKDVFDDGLPFNGSIAWQEYVCSIIGGAISSIEAGFIGSVLLNALGNVIEQLGSGDIDSIWDFAKAVGVGALFGAIGYGVDSIIDNVANNKIISIIGGSNNAKINKKLAAIGLNNLKIGKIGFDKLYKLLYKKFGFHRYKLLSFISLSIGSEFFPQ